MAKQECGSLGTLATALIFIGVLMLPLSIIAAVAGVGLIIGGPQTSMAGTAALAGAAAMGGAAIFLVLVGAFLHLMCRGGLPLPGGGAPPGWPDVPLPNFPFPNFPFPIPGVPTPGGFPFPLPPGVDWARLLKCLAEARPCDGGGAPGGGSRPPSPEDIGRNILDWLDRGRRAVEEGQKEIARWKRRVDKAVEDAGGKAGEALKETQRRLDEGEKALDQLGKDLENAATTATTTVITGGGLFH
jgi:hypothetical protein